MTPLTGPGISRRRVLTEAAGVGVLAPFVAGGLHMARAQEEAGGFVNHPAVGVWVETSSGPPSGYHTIHADGTQTYYTRLTTTFSEESDPKLPVFGFGVWRPVDERAIDLKFTVAWGDTSDKNWMVHWNRMTVNEDGNELEIQWRISFLDEDGNPVINAGPGRVYAKRMEWEPFESPPESEATPGS